MYTLYLTYKSELCLLIIVLHMKQLQNISKNIYIPNGVDTI